MIKANGSVVIFCPIDKVFDFYVNVANMPKWQEDVIEAGFSPGNVPSAGAEFFEKGKFLSATVTVKLKYTQYEPNKLVTAKLIAGAIQSAEVNAAFEAVDGGTKVSLSRQWELGGFFQAMEGRSEKQLQSMVSANLASLKKVLEEG